MTTKPMPPTPDEVSQINAEHQAAVSNSNGSLQHAVACGERLKAAKGKVAHGEWEKWLGQNCPNIGERNARLYMQLASKGPELKKAAVQNGNGVADLSLRGARKLISKPLTEEKKAERKAARAANSSVTVEDLLRDLVVDEIYTALRSSKTVEDVLKLGRMILQRNEKGDSPRIPSELDHRGLPPLPPPPTATAATIRRG
jgi:hypothetical protein